MDGLPGLMALVEQPRVHGCCEGQSCIVHDSTTGQLGIGFFLRHSGYLDVCHGFRCGLVARCPTGQVSLRLAFVLRLQIHAPQQVGEARVRAQ